MKGKEFILELIGAKETWMYKSGTWGSKIHRSESSLTSTTDPSPL